MTNINESMNQENIILVIGGTGKTGRRVVDKLKAKDINVRVGSRSAEIPFDWEDASTWEPALQNVSAAYVTFYPDLAVPGASDAIRAFSELAVKNNVQRLVLLSGRGEEEAQNCEQIVQNAGTDWTILRASWFSQNFSEGFFRDMVVEGNITLPAGDVPEPFIDAEDISDAAVVALTEDGHAGQLYELTGPRMLTFAEAVDILAKESGLQVTYQQIPSDVFTSALKDQGESDEMIAFLDYLFNTVLDGRNANLTDGVQRALGREPRDFAEYVKEAAASGAWKTEEVNHAG